MPAADSERPTPPPQPDSGWNRYNITAVASSGVAIVLLGAAALFAAPGRFGQGDDVNRLVNYRDPNTGAPLRYSAVADQYERAMADGPDHDRNAKIALVGSAVAAAVAATFFVLDAKIGGGAEPAVAIAPAGRGVSATGGLTWRF